MVSRTYPPSFSHDLRKEHGGIKPPELCFELLKSYGNSCSRVLDPFAGVGSTLVACSLAGKDGVGIELNERWGNIYQEVCKQNGLKEQEWFTGDSRTVLQNFPDNSFDFLLTDIPYYSMDKLKHTRGKFSRAGEESEEKLPSSLKIFNEEPIPTKTEWLSLLKSVFKECHRVLSPNAVVLVFIGNMYRNVEQPNSKPRKKIGLYHMLSAEVAQVIAEEGFTHIQELVWLDTGKKLGIYGYPFAWIPSMVDQRIQVFLKE